MKWFAILRKCDGFPQGQRKLSVITRCLYYVVVHEVGFGCIKVSVKENEVPTEKNSGRASIFATKASYISN